MPEDRIERAIEEHGHVLRTDSESTDTVHLPDPDDPEETDCYAIDGTPTLVLERNGQVPMGTRLCQLCRGVERESVGSATNTAEAVRELARENPETVRELLGETGRDHAGDRGD